MKKQQSIYDLTSSELKLRQFGKDVMDLAFYEKDDVTANKLSDLGYRLSRFGDAWSVKIKDLSREEVKLLYYAHNEINDPKNHAKLQKLKDLAAEKIERQFNEKKVDRY